MLLWNRSFMFLLLFVCVLVGAAYAAQDQGEKREITDEPDDDQSKVEDDNFAIDTDNNILVDVITGENGDEVTITDYNKGILAVLTPDDKMCRLHELAAEDRNVDLKTETEELEKISEEKKDLDTSLEKIVEYKESNKPVKEADLGENIAQLCKSKSYKMVWMEAVSESDPNQGSDGTDKSETLLDTVLDRIDKRGKCAFGSKYCCEWLCLKKMFGNCRIKRPRCFKQKV